MEQYVAASESGTPIMRPLFYDFFDDAGSQGIDNQLASTEPIRPYVSCTNLPLTACLWL